MRILFLTHAFNSLTQRLFVELTGRGHEVSVEFDIGDSVTIEAVELFRPDLVIAPYLKRAIPESVWRDHLCLIVHPGIVGDRGPSALDWAIMNGEREWGVTVLQANAEMDAGDIWATASFEMRAARKSSLYRNEVTEAAVAAVLEAVARFQGGGFRPEPLDYGKPHVRGSWHPLMKQSDRAIDWRRDDTAAVLRKIRAADGFPGVLDTVCGEKVYLYDAYEEGGLRGTPGEVIAKRHGAICRATVDGAAWITHLKKKNPPHPPFDKGGSRGDFGRGSADAVSIKLPATMVLAERLRDVPESPVDIASTPAYETYRDIWYQEKNGVGYLHFNFYNGAMSTEQCERLRQAYAYARSRDTRVILLMGGPDFWSNGLNLNVIEAAPSPADESWRIINAIDDLARDIITTEGQLTVAALQGNAGAGGAFLALAADRVWARRGAILNPHYKNMGNLYGSEYWSYLLPRRVGEKARAIMANRLPIGAQGARDSGLIDDCFGEELAGFRLGVEQRAEALAHSSEFGQMLAVKRERRLLDELARPLDQYRAEELERMKLNFYGFDPSYHVARYNFVHKVPHSWTPLHLATHRRQSRGRRRTGAA